MARCLRYGTSRPGVSSSGTSKRVKCDSIACPVGADDPLLGGFRFSNGGRLFAAEFEPGGIFIFELENLTERSRIPVTVRPERELDAFGFFAGDRKLVVVRRARLSSGLFRSSSELRDVTTGKREEYHEYYQGVEFQTISPDARYILHMSGREQIVSESESGRRAFAVMELSRSHFSPDGTMLVSYDGEGLTRWGVPSGKKLGRVQVSVDKGLLLSDSLVFAVSPGNKLVAIPSLLQRNTTSLVSLESGRVLATIECCAPLMDSKGACFSPNGKILVTDTYVSDAMDRRVGPVLRFWRVPEDW